jgi:hypothetical protein
MSKVIAAVILVSALTGCVTSDGPYSRTAVTTLEPQRAAPSVNRQPKATQTAIQVPRRQRAQVALRQRAIGPVAHKAEFPIILGAAF